MATTSRASSYTSAAELGIRGGDPEQAKVTMQSGIGSVGAEYPGFFQPLKEKSVVAACVPDNVGTWIQPLRVPMCGTSRCIVPEPESTTRETYEK